MEFWREVKLARIHEAVQAYKMLVMVHRVIQEGHPSVLAAAERQVKWLRFIKDDYSHWKHYGPLINKHARLLIRELDFHKHYRGFNPDFGFEEKGFALRSGKKASVSAIEALMDIQNDILELQKAVLESLQSYSGRECHLSSLFPLINMSYGIFRLVTFMACRVTESSAGSLGPRYASQFSQLREFYSHCNMHTYLKEQASIPQLPAEAPTVFGSTKGPRLPPRPNESSDTGSSNPFFANSSAIQPVSTGNWWAQDNTGFVAPQQTGGLQPQMEPAFSGQEPFYQQNQLYYYQQQQLAQQQLAQQQLAQQQLAQQQLVQQQLAQQQLAEQQLAQQSSIQVPFVQQPQATGTVSGYYQQPQYYY